MNLKNNQRKLFSYVNEMSFQYKNTLNWIFNLQKSISKLIFAGYTGSRLKIQFIELDFSKMIFQKSSTDQQGDRLLQRLHNPLSKYEKIVFQDYLLCQTSSKSFWFVKNNRLEDQLFYWYHFLKTLIFDLFFILCLKFDRGSSSLCSSLIVGK